MNEHDVRAPPGPDLLDLGGIPRAISCRVRKHVVIIGCQWVGGWPRTWGATAVLLAVAARLGGTGGRRLAWGIHWWRGWVGCVVGRAAGSRARWIDRRWAAGARGAGLENDNTAGRCVRARWHDTRARWETWLWDLPYGLDAWCWDWWEGLSDLNKIRECIFGKGGLGLNMKDTTMYSSRTTNIAALSGWWAVTCDKPAASFTRGGGYLKAAMLSVKFRQTARQWRGFDHLACVPVINLTCLGN